ncbi:hypothetical protein CHRYSEOSP005_31090 [Chryseobacterium sp. Alg-005]
MNMKDLCLNGLLNKIIINQFNTEQVWKMVRKKADGKGRFNKNSFWLAIRNPLYCGKIFIPPHKDEPGYFVVGQHEPLISEKIFDEVQQILDGRKRQIKPKIVSPDNLPLRGFLKCHKCGRTLTGSASRGKMGRYYNYYHCSSSCGVRFKAEETNNIFVKQLRSLIPKKGIADIFIEAIISDFTTKTEAKREERTTLLTQIEGLSTRVKNALIQKIDGKIEDEEYLFIKKYCSEKIEQLEFKLSNLSDINTEIKGLLRSGLKKVGNLDKYYEQGNTEEKRKIISSMFPEFLVFDGTLHRTPRLNSAVEFIYQNTSKLNIKKNGTNLSFLDLSREVTAEGFEPSLSEPKSEVLSIKLCSPVHE